ncbi:DUF692 domain-containing protein [Methylobacterium sp. WSM2598]|uniref:DUF692 domain-containing protein n=1 Tax=Methylobacterium sp. WSM2598 TaxID=398261 RepID=UPI000362F967|nr:DUF692 domain-containing protein [Methylobacterium sp. WSM2598]
MPERPDASAHLGAGIGYRLDLREEILGAAGRVEVVEVMADNYLFRPERRNELAALRERLPIVLHGLDLSVGSAERPNPDYLGEVRRLCRLTAAPYYSDHLAVTRVRGVSLGHLTPVWYGRSNLSAAIDNVNAVQDCLGIPLVLENITADLTIPGAEMTEGEFFRELVRATGCGMLLDVTNIEVNSLNRGLDPADILRSFPLESVVQVHLSGGVEAGGRMIDSHSAPISERSWSLYADLLRRAAARVVIVERDADFDDGAGIMREVSRAGAMLAAARAGAPVSP